MSILTVVPLRWLVKEKHDPFCVVNLKLLLNRLVFLWERVSIKRKKHLHLRSASEIAVRAHLPLVGVLSYVVAPSTQARLFHTRRRRAAV